MTTPEIEHSPVLSENAESFTRRSDGSAVYDYMTVRRVARSVRATGLNPSQRATLIQSWFRTIGAST